MNPLLKRSDMVRDSKVITQFYLPPTHEPYLPSLPSRRASPPFGWYLVRLSTEGWPGWVDLGDWLYTEIEITVVWQIHRWLLDTVQPGRRSWTGLAVAQATNKVVVGAAWCGNGDGRRLQLRSGPTVRHVLARQRRHVAACCNSPVGWIQTCLGSVSRDWWRYCTKSPQLMWQSDDDDEIAYLPCAEELES